MTTLAVALGRGPGTEATRSVARKAALLYRSGEADLILLSGRHSVLATQAFPTTEVADMLVEAIALGVPVDKILKDDWSRDTVSNMVGTKRVLKAHAINRAKLVIVTIPHADKRAAYLARKVLGKNFQITSVTSDYQFSESVGEEAKVAADERKFLLITRTSLLPAPTGNLTAIQWLLRLWHPGYQRRKVADPIRLTA